MFQIEQDNLNIIILFIKTKFSYFLLFLTITHPPDRQAETHKVLNFHFLLSVYQFSETCSIDPQRFCRYPSNW